MANFGSSGRVQSPTIARSLAPVSLAFHTACSDDASEIAVVHNQCVKADYSGHIPSKYIDISVSDRRVEAWRGWICRSQVSMVLARIDGEVVGFSTMQPNNDGLSGEDSVELIGVYVLQDYWGQGIGRALFQHLLDEARDSKFAEIVYWEIESNDTGREFYESLSFRSDGSRRTFLEESNRTIEELRYCRSV